MTCETKHYASFAGWSTRMEHNPAQTNASVILPDISSSYRRGGGGGGNRTRVRKPYTVSTTCVARSFDLAAHPPTGRLMRSESPKFDAVQSDPAQHETP